MYFTNYHHIYRNTNTLSDFSRFNTLSTSARAGVYLGELCSVEIQASEVEAALKRWLKL